MSYRKLPNLYCACLLLLCACQSNNSEWSQIDYGRIARENYYMQNDQYYVQPPPSVIGCVDDDLQNCQQQGVNPYY